jgi:predicted nucleic-acid-binding Zn-ribbon protein
MKNGKCPKCQASAVYRSRGKTTLDTGMRTGDGAPLLNIRRQKRIFDDFKLLYLESYVCRACGYIELYVQDLQELANLETADNWEQIPPANPI